MQPGLILSQPLAGFHEASVHSILLVMLISSSIIQLAALHASHEVGKAKAEEEILAEGAIYSPKHERMLEIEVPHA